MDESDRFDESHNLKYGVVKDEIPESDVYRGDQNPVLITQFEENGTYSLRIGSRVGKDTIIFFDSVVWQAEEYGGTLWFKREVGDETVSTGNLDWSAAFPSSDLGLVGEWFYEQIDLPPYRADVDCPDCGGQVLHLPMSSACEELDCDFYCEGHLVEDADDVEDHHLMSDGEYRCDGGTQAVLTKDDAERWKRLSDIDPTELDDSEATAKAKLALKRRFDDSAWTLVFEFRGPDNRRADGIAVSRTRANNFMIVGLEIKASRSDWLAEKKDPRKQEHVIGVVDEFYVVAARKGIVNEDELPTGWGLLELKPNSERLYKEVESDLTDEQEGTPTRRFWGKLLGKLEGESDGFTEADLQEARSKGYEEGIERGQERAAYSGDQAERKARKWDELTEHLNIHTLDDATLRAVGAAYNVIKSYDPGEDGYRIERVQKLEEYIEQRARRAISDVAELREALEAMGDDPGDPPAVDGGDCDGE